MSLPFTRATTSADALEGELHELMPSSARTSVRRLTYFIRKAPLSREITVILAQAHGASGARMLYFLLPNVVAGFSLRSYLRKTRAKARDYISDEGDCLSWRVVKSATKARYMGTGSVTPTT